MLIPLICAQCGGTLQVENSQVSQTGDAIIVLTGQTFKCPQCGTQHLQGEEMKPAPEKASILINGNLSGNIIIGSGNTFSPPPGPANQVSNTPPKPSKKWWQFWKT